MKTKDLVVKKFIKISTFIFLLISNLSAFSQPADPKVTIGGVSEGKITKTDILKVTKLDVSPENIAIISFTMSYLVGNDDYVELVSNSDKLTSEMIESLKQIKVGTEVSFENIKAKIEDKTIILESVTLKINN